MNRMTIAETAYLAGVFDGEGWFTINKHTGCRLSIAMSDFDVIERLHKTTGVGNLNLRDAKGTKKAQLGWVVNKMEDVEDLIYAILPYLSARRTERAKEVLADIEERRARAEWRKLYFVCGHEKTEENTYHFKNSDKTSCRECGRIRDRARYNEASTPITKES